MKLLRRAAIVAVERGAGRVDAGLLAESYDERLASRTPRRPNPFRAALEDLNAEPPSPVEYAVRKNNRRSKARAGKPSASEVLGRKG